MQISENHRQNRFKRSSTSPLSAPAIRRLLALWLLFALLPAAVFSAPDTLRICALRVEFQYDTSELTTGNGKFMVDTVTTQPYAIDPAPHDRQYFQDQILAAANYFKAVSNGKLIVTGDVFPSASKGAFQLPKPMTAYNPNTTAEAINQGIANLFLDAVNAADASQDNIDFGSYDLVVVFHAGVGKDINIGYDTTPQDIPSLYLNEDFLKMTLGSGFDGIPVNNGAHKIRYGILLPETENQDGYQIALTGMFVSNIGSYLGFYDLFSPTTGQPGVARFGLMDAGLLNLNGLVPAPPCAFSRQLLGWDEPELITQPTKNIRLSRFGKGAATYPTTVRIPINEDEYYLLEYRGDSKVNIDSLYSEVYYQKNEPPTYLEILKRFYGDKIQIGSSGVLIGVDDYDWGLPGAGILIWHIDERIIREKGPQNRVNDDPDYRGVDLEEADGSQDIGHVYSILEAGFQKELGWFADFWFRNRPDYLEGFELYRNEFSDRTTPNTRSNRNQAKSHITLKNFSANTSSVMSFDFERDWYEAGFPATVIQKGEQVVVAASGTLTDQNAFIFLLTNSGALYAVGAGGQGFLAAEQFQLAQLGFQPHNGHLALATRAAGFNTDLLVGVANDRLFALPVSDVVLDSALAFRIPPFALPASPVAGPVAAENTIYVACANDSVYAYDPYGNLLRRQAQAANVSDLLILPGGQTAALNPGSQYAAAIPSPAGGFQLVAYSAQKKGFTVTTANQETVLPVDAAPVGQFALADADGNGTYDLIYNGPHLIYGYDFNGAPLSGFPLNPGLTGVDELVGAPLIADLDGDGQPDFISASAQGQIFALRADGKPVPGFPLTIGGKLSGSPAIVQLDADEPLELVAWNTDGIVSAWQLDIGAADDNLWWLSENFTPGNNALVNATLTYRPQSASLMPPERVYNYPNPNQGDFTTIRYYLNEPATVTIRIFDAAGAPVTSFNGPGAGQAFNEIRWNVAHVASGIYLCQVEAKGNSQTVRKIIKIMVVH